MGADRLVRARLKSSPSKKDAVVFGRLLILIMPISRLHVDLDQLEK